MPRAETAYLHLMNICKAPFLDVVIPHGISHVYSTTSVLCLLELFVGDPVGLGLLSKRGDDGESRAHISSAGVWGMTLMLELEPLHVAVEGADLGKKQSMRPHQIYRQY